MPGQKAKEGWPDWAGGGAQCACTNAAMPILRQPHPARERLAYDEFFAHQVTLSLARASLRKGKGRPSIATGALQQLVFGVAL